MTTHIIGRVALAALALALLAPAPARAEGPGDVIAFVVDRANPTSDVSADELKQIFLGKRKQWPHGARIVPIDLDPGAERDAVTKRVLGMDRGGVERYWVDQKVRGAGAAPKVAPSTGAAVKLVAKIRGAIAYVPLSEVDGTVKVLKIGGVAPGQPGYPVVAN
jgi:phosphate transport system substrate-binding protein